MILTKRKVKATGIPVAIRTITPPKISNNARYHSKALHSHIKVCPPNRRRVKRLPFDVFRVKRLIKARRIIGRGLTGLIGFINLCR
jgi:hypothetical protein